MLRSLHDDMGHMGMERTLDLVRTRFFWPKMSLSVEEKIKTCERCVSYETAIKNTAKMVDRNKCRFDKRVVVSTLEVGNRVLMRNVKQACRQMEARCLFSYPESW